MGVLLQVENLNKRFPQVWANRDVSFDVEQGETHCLLGENGAGKTTLTECLCGTYRPDSGTITFKGEVLELGSPRDAIDAGIGMVHQHFVLASPLTVLENIIVGTKLPFLPDFGELEDHLTQLCNDYEIDLDLNATISHLSVGERQWVEILKALYVEVDLLILDEPTAVLTPIETRKLFGIIDKMKQHGLSVIFITHKLSEVMSVSDRVTTLRKGEVVGTVRTADVDKEALARMMVGRDVVFQVHKSPMELGDAVLEVRDLHALGDRGDPALRGISLYVRSGEILGLAGVSGNGQRELFEVLVGVRQSTQGEVSIAGEPARQSPRARIDQGIASVPEDRIEEGLIMDFQLSENAVLGLHKERLYSGRVFLKRSQIKDFAERSIKDYEIDTPSAAQLTRLLSGGNLQKVVLARELSRDPACLIANQPTRGLDVGAIENIHNRILQQRQQGTATLLISEDLEEILSLSDRVAVIYRGRIAGSFESGEVDLDKISFLMAGIGVDQPESNTSLG